MADLRVLVIGCTPMAEHATHAMTLLPDVHIAGVVNLSRKKGLSKANYSPMLLIQEQLGYNYTEVDDINALTTLTWIAKRQPEIILQVGWSQIFEPALLRLASRYCLGLHAAPLPKGRGAAILNWKLIEGAGPWGISLFVMQEKTDTGEIVDFEPFMLEERDDVRMAYCKADRAAVAILLRSFPLLAQGKETLSAQNDREATRYYRRRPEDGRLSAEMDTKTLLNYIRALTRPYPGAFIDTPKGRLFIWRASFWDKKPDMPPGSIAKILPGEGIVMDTKDGALLITEVTPPDGLTIWADIWANDSSLFTGYMLFKQ